MSVQRLVYEHKVQEKWLEGKMSNFDYLMALNTLAGRSYNDLCQVNNWLMFLLLYLLTVLRKKIGWRCHEITSFLFLHCLIFHAFLV